MATAISPLPITLGCMTFGDVGTEGARISTTEEIEKLLDIFQSHGHNELDTARSYAGGSSEVLLGKIDWQKRGLIMDTKLYPHHNPVSHSKEDLRKYLDIQLEALNTDCLDMWYLHAPDRTIPFEETFETVNTLFLEGKFKRFGISNFMSWEVAHCVGLCEKNGWIKPTAYQGIYNLLHRNVEAELFPCLRALGLSFYEFNPLLGGLFTGRYERDAVPEDGSRFDPEKAQGKNYRSRYWKEEYFGALELIQPVADKYNLTLAEIALRWISNHSLMKRSFGDNVLIGASSASHLEQNLVDLEKGELPEEVLKVIDEAWQLTKGVASKYWH